MKYCPDCGKELGAGAVKCWNPDCGVEFVVPIGVESSDPPIKKSDELRQLESEYRLATRGLAGRAPRTYAAMIIGFLIFVVVALLLAASGKQLFPGWPLVWAFGIIAVSVLIYYSFVYRQACKLKAEIAKEKERLQFDHGRVK